MRAQQLVLIYSDNDPGKHSRLEGILIFAQCPMSAKHIYVICLTVKRWVSGRGGGVLAYVYIVFRGSRKFFYRASGGL